MMFSDRRRFNKALEAAIKAMGETLATFGLFRHLRPGDLDERGRTLAIELCTAVEQAAREIRERLTGGAQ